MPYRTKTIFIEPLAPAKPRLGAPCNGCGVCCLAAPCPLGMLLSRRTQGACAALRWDAAGGLYRCGALVDPRVALEAALPCGARVAARWLARPLRLLARRWIAAGKGCDSTLEASVPDPVSAHTP